ncbi:MAG: hypothetical protein JNG89_06465 [Planctomycetaceae bacterium]|nr:hypothetical protein [Planctomycetaceae bacterium]
MRSFTLRHWLAAVLVVAVVLPASSMAGIYFNLGFGFSCNGCGLGRVGCQCPPCGGCYRPPSGCVCPPPTVGPALPTGCAPQVQIQRQAYVEQVPVTTYQQVSETVYVPQQVTRMVPQTVMMQQTRYRDIAVQAAPQPTIGFAPVSGCSSCGDGHGFAPAAVHGYPSVLPTAAPANVPPYTSGIPSMPSISVSPYAAPSAVPQYDDVNWTDVRPRTPTPSHAHPPVRGTSLFRPAPSAATVWQSRF